MKNERSGKPSKQGIETRSGYCMACGLPRATVPVKAKVGTYHMWIHAKCQAGTCKLCKGPRLSFQVFCGARCSSKYEAGERP